jgi:ankyrin repeat protein
MDAAFVGDVRRVRDLISAGADVNEVISDGTPLLESLREHPDFFDDDALRIVEMLLEAGASVGLRQPSTGRTPLHEAARAGPKAVALLLARGADPNAQSFDGSTPLHECVTCLGVDSARVLLRAGANTTSIDRAGLSPADLAVQEAAANPDLEEAQELAVLLSTVDGP